MSLSIVIQRTVELSNIPEDKDFSHWINAAQIDTGKNAEITLRIVSVEEIQSLNRDYRSKDMPTNVLSFSSEVPLGPELHVLGDIVICGDIVAQEAHQYGKALQDRWAHMVIHACLHIQGFDHQDERERQIMENKEVEVLKGLGFSDPYQVD